MKASEFIERLENELLYLAGVNRASFDVLKADIDSSTKTTCDRVHGKARFRKST